MKKQIDAGILCLVAMFILLVNMLTVSFPQYAAVFFAQGKTVKEVVQKYNQAPVQAKVKILLIPGHEPDFGGAEYMGILERDVNVALAEKIADNLRQNSKFEVIIGRDFYNWNSDLANYFKSNMMEIEKWKDGQKSAMYDLVKEGKVELVDSPGHSIAPTVPAMHLYGINKWANENGVDITLHIHFNDNPMIKGRPRFSGFAIYVPEQQYSNSSSSVELATDLMKGLSVVSSVSDMEQESTGVTPDQDLIAIGRFNTADTLSVLIEYAYIYESKLRTKELRKAFIDEMASATADSLVIFFESRQFLI